MGLVDELGYTARDKPRARWVLAVAASRSGSWVSHRVMHHLDRWAFRLTGGRTTAMGLVSGLPVLMITTTGARTGRERTVPLVGIPFDGAVALVGSNFGQAPTPGWVHNLGANPRLEVTFRGRTVGATARRADPGEVEGVFVEAARWYSGFALYRSRVKSREIPVFILARA